MQTLSESRKIYRKPSPAKRCSSSAAGQKTVRAAEPVTNGFLNTLFPPRFETVRECPSMNAKEVNALFTSFDRLANAYGLTPPEVQAIPYPLNVLQARHHLQQQLAEQGREELLILNEKGKTFAAVLDEIENTSNLFYIPVKPLHDWLQTDDRTQASELLLAVFAYIYHVANIPYYRQAYSYIGEEYEMFQEWVLEPEEPEPDAESIAICEERNRELEEAKQIGDHIEYLLLDRRHLKEFAQRLSAFTPADELEQECMEIARLSQALYKAFPKENIYRNISYNKPSEDEEYETYPDDVAPIEKYVHFVATGRGWLAELLEESVNTDLSEYAEMEKPICITLFNRSRKRGGNLHFERRLFSLIRRLCTFLNQLS